MRKLVVVLLVSAVVVVIGGGSASAVSGSKKTITVPLTGAQEVPKGSPRGSGTARIGLNSIVGRVCFSLTWSGIDTPTASHIHKGPKGKAGSIVVAFFGTTPGKHSGCVSAKKSVVAAIIKHPGSYYVNIHTMMFPGGALRGQL